MYALLAYSLLIVKCIHPFAGCQETGKILRLQCEVYQEPVLKGLTDVAERKVCMKIIMVLSNHTIVEKKTQSLVIQGIRRLYNVQYTRDE